MTTHCVQQSLNEVPSSFHRKLRLTFTLAIVVAVLAIQMRAQIGIVKPFDPNAPPNAPSQAPAIDMVTTGNGIEYHGGSIMPGPHNVYFLWYGTWTNNTATAILPDFIAGLNGSLYFNTNTTYGDNSNNIANTISLAGQAFDSGSQGTALGKTGVAAALTKALNDKTLPVDANGLYFVLTSPDVTEGQFCAQTNGYCGYHTSGTFNTTDIKFGFVGNPATQCPSTAHPRCSVQATTPNSNEGADAMANVLAHEINETVTDPDGDAWFHVDGTGEVGDLCSFQFGTELFTTSNGARANVTLGARTFLIQQNWLNAHGGVCAMSWTNGKLPLAGTDFDGDRAAEFAIWRPDPTAGTWLVARSSDGETVTRTWGITGDIPVPGDYDGDGRTDFAVWRPDPTSGTWFVTRSSGGTMTQTWGITGDIPVPGDYDGDGKTDFAIWRPSTGTWWVIRSSDGAVMTRTWGVTGDIPVPGDYDGDGKTDFAVWRPSPSGGTWFVLRSSDGIEMTQTWGVTGDIPVPGDYDGDGKTDFAVWRPNPSGGTWFVIRSSDGTEMTRTWGVTGDIPVPADYDGDGKTDFAIWRPSTGTWWVIRSSDGGILTRTWGVTGDVPLNKPIGQ